MEIHTIFNSNYLLNIYSFTTNLMQARLYIYVILRYNKLKNYFNGN